MSFKAVLISMFYILLVFFLQNIYGRNKLFPDNFPYFRLSNILNNLNSNSKFRDFILFILTIVNVSRLVKQYKRKCQNIVFGICLCFPRWGEAARPMSTVPVHIPSVIPCQRSGSVIWIKAQGTLVIIRNILRSSWFFQKFPTLLWKILTF